LCYLAQSDAERAIDDFQRAIEVDPGYAPAYNNRGAAYLAKNEFERAMVDHIEALRLGLSVADAYSGFARLWATCADPALRDGPLAVELATEACELSGWQDWTCLRTLAAAHAECGDLEAAVAWAEKALACAPQHGREICRADLKQYQDGSS
jgi:serine/threonine-protein kinase